MPNKVEIDSELEPIFTQGSFRICKLQRKLPFNFNSFITFRIKNAKKAFTVYPPLCCGHCSQKGLMTYYLLNFSSERKGLHKNCLIPFLAKLIAELSSRIDQYTKRIALYSKALDSLKTSTEILSDHL